MGIVGQSDQQIAGKWFRFTVFDFNAGSTTFETDPSAMCNGAAGVVRVFHLEGLTEPTATVAGTSSTKSTVTVSGAASTYGRILVITMHGTSVGGVH